MGAELDRLVVLVVDCQSSGATPAYGDLLELGWGTTSALAEVSPPRAEWIRPATDRPITSAVRKLTGWNDDALSASIAAEAAWTQLLASMPDRVIPVPTVIHYARFELAFLRHLHGHAAPGEFPLDVVCLHAIGARLFPDLPRRNLRALAGYLGHSPELLRRSRGHVEASAFLWRALVPKLAEHGVRTWTELRAWLAKPATTRRGGARRAFRFPVTAERRSSLPDAPGVYRFCRSNGDILYVGRAASVKKRVASHFTGGARPLASRERSLEMLSQAHDVDVTPTATILEAALLEVEEIHRLDPPYNVQLRTAERRAWFATPGFRDAISEIDDAHRVGPLPSERALDGLAAIRGLLLGEEATTARRASAVGVPARFSPDADVFGAAWRAFASEELGGTKPVRTRLLDASRRIVVREREEDPDAGEEEAPPTWDVDTVRRYLERVVVGQGTLVRRARLLALLTDAHVYFREPRGSSWRLLVLRDGAVVERADLPEPPPRPRGPRPPPRSARLAGFDARRYDRLRVLATELRRVATHGGAVALSAGAHVLRTRG